jgi:hypothetical protein
MFSVAHDAKTNASRVVKEFKVESDRAEHRIRLQDESLIPATSSTLYCGGFYERDTRSNSSHPAFPSFREITQFARSCGIVANPSQDTPTSRTYRRDTRYTNRKIVALPRIGSPRVGGFAVKVSQLSRPKSSRNYLPSPMSRYRHSCGKNARISARRWLATLNWRGKKFKSTLRS